MKTAICFLAIWLSCCYGCCRVSAVHEWTDKDAVVHKVSLEYVRLFDQNIKGFEVTDPSGVKVALKSQSSQMESLKALIDVVGPTVAPTLLELLKTGAL